MKLTFIGTAEQISPMEDLRDVLEQFFGSVVFVNVEDDEEDVEQGGTDHDADSK